MDRKLEFLKSLISLITTFLITAFVVLFINTYILIINANVPTSSMYPTISAGDHLMGNRLSYISETPKRYDIIIFEHPDGERKLLIKRVIGLPGDEIDIRDGHVYINGEAAREEFCREESSTLRGDMEFPVTVPPGCYFCLGDNRTNSEDSRYWENHFVEEDTIAAKALFCFYPLRSIKIF